MPTINNLDFSDSFKQEYYGTLEDCEKCGNSGERWCTKDCLQQTLEATSKRASEDCHELREFPDESALQELRKSVEKALKDRGLGKCSCENDNIQNFRAGYDHLLCTVCRKKTYLSRQSKSTFRKCQCENTNEDMLVTRNNQRICGICGRSHGYVPTKRGERLECLRCHNNSTDGVNLYEEDGDLTYISCSKCGYGKGSGKELIKNISDLSLGNHVTWLRAPFGYYHHALVVSISPRMANGRRRLGVIEYGKQSLKTGICVSRRDIDVDEENSNMYRLNYPAKYSGEEAIARAESRLGEHTYNVLVNNCEHFVRWCRNGESVCKQVHTVKQKLSELQKSFGAYLSGKKLGVQILKFSSWVVARDAVTETTAETAEFLYHHGTSAGLSPVFEVLGAAAVVAFEAWSFYRSYRRHKSELKNGQISTHEFANKNIRSGLLSTGRGIGAIAGGILGEIFIPVPILGSTIGAFIGGFLGQLLGHFFGTIWTHRRDKNAMGQLTQK